MMPRRSGACALGALWLLSCTPSPVAPRPLAITGGAADPGHPAVVALVAKPVACGETARVFCTGTLVAPRAVVTAAHCLDEAPPGGAEVMFGDRVDAPAERAAVAAMFAHPAWQQPVNDLAVIALARAVATTPLPLRRAPFAAADVGTALTLVGFGADDDGHAGDKRSGTGTVAAVDAGELTVAPAPALSCGGDSGGPALSGADDAVAGVVSFGDAQCRAFSTYTRVDVHVADFLEPTLAMIAALPPPTAQRPVDRDADTCNLTCARDDQCPADLTCVGGRCGLFGMAPGRFGAACIPGGSCGAGVCVSGVPCRCYEPCGTSAGCRFGGRGDRERTGPLGIALGLMLLGARRGWPRWRRRRSPPRR